MRMMIDVEEIVEDIEREMTEFLIVLYK